MLAVGNIRLTIKKEAARLNANGILKTQIALANFLGRLSCLDLTILIRSK